MGRAKKAVSEVRDVVRFLATGRTRSRKDAAALGNYQRYQADEMKRERRPQD